MPRSSGSIVLLFVTSALTVFGADSYLHRNDDDWNDSDTRFSSATTQPSRSSGHPYYYDSQYHHWWYFGTGSHDGGMFRSHSMSGSRSGTSRGGFGSTGHAHGSHGS